MKFRGRTNDLLLHRRRLCNFVYDLSTEEERRGKISFRGLAPQDFIFEVGRRRRNRCHSDLCVQNEGVVPGGVEGQKSIYKASKWHFPPCSVP